jgi:hypothetical protein
VFEELIPILINFLKTSSQPVRDLSAKLLAEVFYKSLHKTNEISSMIILQLAKSSVCYSRISYIIFCVHISGICSHNMFCKYFLPSLIPMARDPIIDVVYAFAVNYVSFRVSLRFGDSELQKEFRAILNFYLEADDKFLVNCSISADEKIDKVYSEYYGANAEAKENLKIKAENEAVAKNVPETKPVVLEKRTKENIQSRPEAAHITLLKGTLWENLIGQSSQK